MKQTHPRELPIANPAIGAAERRAVMDVMDSGRLADGPKVREFEAAFASTCNADQAVATSNGTTALHAALVALGIGDGDTVVTTPFSFIATANAVRLVGARPVFADIDPQTYTLDPDAVATVASEHDVTAILAVHLYGLPAHLGELREVADAQDAYLVEDAAQAHGANYRGRPVGALGDIGCFSFYPTKNMTTGEGGMIVTDDASIADAARKFVNHGRSETYVHERLGHNFRMTSMSAALGVVQLARLPAFIDQRRRNAASLTRALSPVDGVVTPVEPDNVDHAYHQYTIRVADRDGLARHLAAAGIGSGIYYPTCIHEQPAYTGSDCQAPIAERTAREVISLPVHPGINAADIDRVASEVSSYVC